MTASDIFDSLLENGLLLNVRVIRILNAFMLSARRHLAFEFFVVRLGHALNHRRICILFNDFKAACCRGRVQFSDLLSVDPILQQDSFI